jgi:hypothetical protein
MASLKLWADFRETCKIQQDPGTGFMPGEVGQLGKLRPDWQSGPLRR